MRCLPPDCNLTQNANFTGTIVVSVLSCTQFRIVTWDQNTSGIPDLSCDGDANDNAGCGVVEWSRASYGPIFDEQGGGVFAMKWDEDGIAVCKEQRLRHFRVFSIDLIDIQGHFTVLRFQMTLSTDHQLLRAGVLPSPFWSLLIVTRLRIL